MSRVDIVEQVYDIAYGSRVGLPPPEHHAAYATALRSLYARHGVEPSRGADNDLRALGNGMVVVATANALKAGITPLEIIAVARLAYPKGNP